MKATKDDIQILVEHIDVAKKDDEDLRGIAELRTYIDKVKGQNGELKYTAWSRMDYQIIIKKFWKWLHNRQIEDEEDWITPKLVKFIKPQNLSLSFL